MEILKVGPVPAEIKYSEAVKVVLAPSRRAIAFVLLAGGATLALAIAMPFAAPWKALLALAIVASVLEWKCRPRVLVVRAHRSKALEVLYATGRHRAGTLRDGSFVAPWLTLIRWRPEGTRSDRTILILPDMIDAQEFRRLRVLLKWA